jgi:hypothetical protein
MDVYLVRFDGLRGTGTVAIVAEDAERAYDRLMAEFRERMWPQTGPRLEEIKRKLAEGPADFEVPAVHLVG